MAEDKDEVEFIDPSTVTYVKTGGAVAGQTPIEQAPSFMKRALEAQKIVPNINFGVGSPALNEMLLSNAPMVGAIAGSLVPGPAKFVASPALAGGGELLRQAYEGTPTDARKVGIEAATAGVGMGIGEALPVVGGVARKVLGPPTLKFGGTMTGLGKGIEKAWKDPAITAWKNMSSRLNLNKIGRIAGNVTKNAGEKLKDVGTQLGLVREAMTDVPFDYKKAQAIKDNLMVMAGKESRTALKKLPSQLDELYKKLDMASAGKMSAREMDKVVEQLDDFIRWTSKPEGMEFKSWKAVATEMRNQIRSSIDFPGYDKTMTAYSKAKEAIGDVAAQSPDALAKKLANWDKLGRDEKRALIKANQYLGKGQDFIDTVKRLNLSREMGSPKSYNPVVQNVGIGGAAGAGIIGLATGNLGLAASALAPFLASSPALWGAGMNIARKEVPKPFFSITGQLGAKAVKEVVSPEELLN